MSAVPADSVVVVPTRARRNRYLQALRTPAGLSGLVLVAVVVVAGVAAPLLTSSGPNEQINDALLKPSLHHLLGTDEFGRDLWARVLYGIRIDLIVGVIGVAISAVVGSLLGLLSATYEKVDFPVSRLFDVILAFPALVLGLALAAVLTPGTKAIALTIVIANVPLFGRLARTAVRQERGREYVMAAQVVGGSPRHILFRHVLPNSLDPLIVQFTLSMSTAVFIEGGMSFVGIGVQLPTPSLGNLLNSSLPYLYFRATYAIGPIVAVSALMIGLYLLADAFNREWLRR